MRVEAVHAVVEPVARELFVVRRISGVEREAPDEEKTQEQSREERWQEMLVEGLGEHFGGRKGNSARTSIVTGSGRGARIWQ